MNYFSLLNIPQSFSVDISALEVSYFKAQQLCHPDRFIGKPAADRQAAMQLSADMNSGYNVLKKPLLRARHLLSLHGVLVGTDNDTQKPSQALLIEVMELSENPPEAKILAQMEEDSINHIEEYCRIKNWDAMAEETLRLGYLAKL